MDDDAGKPSRARRVLGNVIRGVLGVTVGLAVAEGAFHVRDDGAFPHLNVYVPDAARGVRLVPGATQRIRFARSPVTDVRINGEGYRGAAWPPPSADEVVVVGDSQVFGLGVEEHETFAAALASSLGAPRVVRNLGVPTYGPAEYNAVLEEQLARRPAKTVVYTVNLANDLFEATRPNRERHAVWDGWAVRKESAPERVVPFPGRALLFSRSHAFYAARRFLHERATDADERGFASEGTWRDIGHAAADAHREHEAEAKERDRVAKQRDAEARKVADHLAVAEVAVEAHASDLPVLEDPRAPDREPDLPKEGLYRAARLDPGDIVTVSSGESSRGVQVNAEHIRRGALLRLDVERALRKKAEATRDEELAHVLARRDALRSELDAARTAPPPEPVVVSPLGPALRAAKRICDAHGARLLVVALPLDVQVSSSEWAKYGVAPVDMTATRVLVDDVVVAARAVGAEGLDVIPALAAAEPGAFLDGDIHMTPKGHRAVADAIALALGAPPPGAGAPAPTPSPGTRMARDGGGAAVPVDPAFLAHAEQALSAARRLAERCTLRTAEGQTVTDACTWTAEDAAAVTSSAAALAGLSGAPPSGPGVDFADEARVFATWASAPPTPEKQGTLVRYQALARAWNAWRPDRAVPIDAAAPPAWMEVADAGTGHLVWRRCNHGPCITTVWFGKGWD